MKIDLCLKTVFIYLSSIFLLSSPAKAQLVPDNTLGRESSRVVPVNSSRDNIEGGAIRGSNLFHSFREFNVAPNSSVYFNNSLGIKNIINRVTGRNISNIFGTLGVNGNANLYLINPNGIVFGDGAKLDIRGTFVGTTADGIRLGNNHVYSASNPESSSLLTVEPGALFVNQIRSNPSKIINRGTLETNPGANITLSGDSIENAGSLVAPGGNVFLEAINGDINTGNINTIELINGGGDIEISATGAITVNGRIDASGGDFLVNLSETELLSDSLANSGDISLKAGKNITLNNDSILFASGTFGGNINIETINNNLIANQAVIRNYSFGNREGTGGNTNVTVRAIQFSGGSLLQNSSEGVANAGDMRISTDLISLKDGAQITNSTGITNNSQATGNSGNLTISARNIELIGTTAAPNFFSSGIFVSTVRGTGNAGKLTIKTDRLSLVDGAEISASTLGQGNAGNLTISAKNIELIAVNPANNSPSSISATTFEGTGNAGELTIKTDSLRLVNGAVISASTFAQGNAGNLTISAKNIELIAVNPANNSPSSIIASTYREKGNGGELTIKTDSLRLVDGAVISASTFRQGNAGNINISAKNMELIGINSANGSPSGISSSTNDFFQDSTGTGNGGKITITTEQLKIKDGANISVSNISRLYPPGLGRAGNIDIVASEIILDRGRISATGYIKGGGDISIDSSNFIRLVDRSEISTDVGETIGFTGGNITIDTPIIIASPDRNRISARAVTSAGGNININTNSILGYPQFLEIDASSALGIDGTVNITGITDLSSELVRAEPIIISLTALELDECPLNGEQTALSSRGSDRSLNKFKVEGFALDNKDSKLDNPLPLKPAVGWYRKTDGTVVLTDDPLKVRPLNMPVDYPSDCSN